MSKICLMSLNVIDRADSLLLLYGKTILEVHYQLESRKQAGLLGA